MVNIVKGKAFNKILAAHVAGAPELWAKAYETEMVALTLAGVHNKTGNYAGHIEVRPRTTGKYPGVDVEVVATDPAAGHIEFGHRLSGNPPDTVPGQEPDGKIVEERFGKPWVGGLHIMRNAAIAVGGVGGHRGMPDS